MLSKGKIFLLFAIFVLLTSISANAETWKVLLDRADSLSKAQRHDSAIVIASEALIEAKRTYGEVDSSVALILHRIGYYYQNQNPQASEALDSYRRALDVWQKLPSPQPINMAKTLSNLGVLSSMNMGKWHEAEEYHASALEIKRKYLPKNDPSTAVTLNNLGNLYTSIGNYAVAEDYLWAALKMRRACLPPGDPKIIGTIINLGLPYYYENRVADAESLWLEALRLSPAVGDPNVLLGSVDNLAALYLLELNYIKAESLCLEALVIIDTLRSPDPRHREKLVRNLALAYHGLHRWEEAEHYFVEDSTISRNLYGNVHPEYSSSLYNLANLYRDQGRSAEARPLYERALLVQENAVGPDHPGLAYCLDAFSKYHRVIQDFKNSLACAKRAFEIRLRNFRDNGYVLCEKDALVYSQQMRASANNYLTCYFDAKATGQILTETTSNIVLSSKGQVSDDIFARYKVLVSETDSATLSLAELWRHTKFQLSELFVNGPGKDTTGAYRRHLDSLNSLANELETRLARKSTSFRRQQDYNNVTSERIASLLPDMSVLVEFLKYEYFQLKPDSTISRYLALVLDNANQPAIVNLGDASVIEPLIDKYRQHILKVSSQQHMPLNKDKEEYQKISQALYDKIWKPIDDKVSGKGLVFVAPDGALDLISFAGLTDDNGEYLVEKYALHNLSSGRDLIRLKNQLKPAEGLFALGDPDYDASPQARVSPEEKAQLASVSPVNLYVTRNVRSGCGDLREMKVNPLRGTRREVEKIVQDWQVSGEGRAVSYFGLNASEDNFKANAPGKQVIHLATHGYFLEGKCRPASLKKGISRETEYVGENPLLLSGLLLAGANLHGEGADSVGVEDGILTAEEVTAMNLEGTRLVVLSACETGLGEVKSGEGVYGLRRAFQMAGARTVVSALWRVSDETTAEMMTPLYSRSNKSLMERIRDLQLAQIKKLRSEGFSDHPYNWAAFIALGDWR